MRDVSSEPAAIGVRERNRRALRRRLSDTATAMFLARGFDEVRVSDIADACGVSTKTVWNHFPTKEALLLDRGERLADALRQATNEHTDVLDVVVTCIESEIEQLGVVDDTSDQAGPVLQGVESVQAFVRLVEANPGLRAAAADRFEQLVRLAADALAVQTGTPAHAPHNQIAAGALVSLWRLHFSSLLNAGEQSLPLRAVQDQVRHDVKRGAELVARLMTPVTESPATLPG